MIFINLLKSCNLNIICISEEASLEVLCHILEAIRQQDAETAINIVLDSINNWQEIFKAHYQEGQEYRVEETKR